MYWYKNAQGSVIIRVKLYDSSVTTGAGKTGLTSASSGLIISTIADNEASPTVYTAAGSTIEGITTLGTYAAPTATKCRFKLVDDTNHPGIYEIQLADARYAVSNAKSLLISISGVANTAQQDIVIPLTSVDPYDGVRFGQTALPNAAAEAAGGLYTRGSGAGQVAQDANGRLNSNAAAWNGTTIPGVDTAGYPKVTVKDGTGTGEIDTASGRVQITEAQIDQVVDETWDEVLTGTTHNVQNSAGKLLRNAGGGSSLALFTGSCQANTVANKIKLATDAPTQNNCLIGMTVVAVGATGAQTNTIVAYDGATKLATVARNWVNTPTTGYTYSVYAAPTSVASTQGVAQAGGASTMTLATSASAVDDFYNDSFFFYIESGTGAGQTRIASDYVGATKVLTVSAPWDIEPDNTSVYSGIPFGSTATDSSPAPPTATEIAGAVGSRALGVAPTAGTWDEAMAAARGQAMGKWSITGTELTVFASDGTTPLVVFDLAGFVATPATVPTSRTPQ